MSVHGYLTFLDDAWANQNADSIAKLVSYRDAHVHNSRLHLQTPEFAVQGVLDDSIGEIVAAHLRGIWAYFSKQDAVEAFNCQIIALNSFNKLLSETKESRWPLPIMYTLCLDLRLLAAKADLVLKAKNGKPDEMMEKSAEILMNSFRACTLDSKTSNDVTKRWGMLNIVNQLFKIYFKVNKLHLCKPLIRAIEQSNLKDKYPQSEQVTFKYYVGRQFMFDNKFQDAEKYLSYAFENCHKESKANKKAILTYLIPVKMLLGRMPSMSLLAKYNLDEFREVVLAVKEGNLLRLNEALETNEKYFLKVGIFLILEKLKIITYRNLFKKVAIILATHQIPIDAFLKALKMMKVEDIDTDETECILANLIYDGRIKGYISHQHKKLVVSKQNAFPSLSVA